MAAQRRPATRKSIAHLPSDLASEDKENELGEPEPASHPDIGTPSANKTQRKTRSKSLGPGGLDALKDDAGNRRKSAAAPPKSILKPSIPLSPLKEIPSRKRATPERKPPSPSKSPNKPSRSPTKSGAECLPSASPRTKSTPSPRKTSSATSPLETTTPPGSATGRVVREGEFKGDDAKEQRRLQREEIQKQREVRRKSMANRRVSFAPEATLHTWDHMEDMQDSTTSSASTDATRRSSAISTNSANVDNERNGPSTASEQNEDDLTGSSLTHQREFHQNQRRRRSSGIPPMNFNNPEETFSSSPYSTASAAGGEATVTERHSDADQSPSPSSDPSERSPPPDRVVPVLNGATPFAELAFADVQQDKNADDEDGEMTMEMAIDDVTDAFRPFSNASKPWSSYLNVGVEPEREDVNPFSPAFENGMSTSRSTAPPHPHNANNDDMSMDITRAVGGIIQSRAAQGTPGHQIHTSPKRRQSLLLRRQSSGSSTALGDNTMDFTAAVGGIQSVGNMTSDTLQADQDEELSMELTSVFGGIYGKTSRKSVSNGNLREPLSQQRMIEEYQASLDGDNETDMEMTAAVGGIVKMIPTPQSSQAGHKSINWSNGDGEVTKAKEDIGTNHIVGKPRFSQAQSPRVKSPTKFAQLSPSRRSASALATGSPSIRMRQEQDRSFGGLTMNETPTKAPHTPSKQVTPKPARPTTPGKTPPSKNVAMRQPSPRQLFRQEIKTAKNSPLSIESKQFRQDDGDGQLTPSEIVKTSRPFRTTTGIGLEKEGLGSPRVAALLDRRASICDQADVFAPQGYESREVRFEDPRNMEYEISRENEENTRKGSDHFIMDNEGQVDTEDKDVTSSLKEAIGSMTPKKNKPKPRKSLAVGTARGILGKRPVELDEDEEDEEGTPKGLRGREASPVKKIRLQAPPPASETIGRSTRPRHSLGAASGNERPRTPMVNPPVQRAVVTTPSHKDLFKDAEALPSAQKPLPVLGEFGTSDELHLVGVERDENIRLQDFLDLTNIRFMELSTTKRRHTVAPSAGQGLNEKDYWRENEPSKVFEDAVAAGACTLPMLEMYQHSCRELKKYISDGRKIVREIEANTFEENPALFGEYLSASPSDRAVMDNQFKNMKTHARLVSKGMWYEWRMKLLEGLRGVLVSESDGLHQDSHHFEDFQNGIQRVLPSIVKEHSQLQQESSLLQERADELADCDQEELRHARQQILSIDEQIRQRRQRIDNLRWRSNELDTAIEFAADLKIENLEAIRESNRVLEEYRGWSESEVAKHRHDVDCLEAKHGWNIVTVSSTELTMVYRDQLQLIFDMASFKPLISRPEGPSHDSSAISLSYVGGVKDHRPQPLTTEKRFFLQLMRAHLQCLRQNETHVKDLLYFVSAGWTQALAVAEQIRRLNLESITECSILGDERLAASSMMLLPDVKTKVKVVFEVGAAMKDMHVTVKLKVRAEVVYGEEYREDRMKDFLRARVDDGVEASAHWADAVRELKKKLKAQGRKQGQ